MVNVCYHLCLRWSVLNIRAGEPMAFEFFGTFLVITEDTPVIELEPIVTGATSIVFEPMKALSSIIVLFFFDPS
jgi:hypothetical protein